MSWLTEGPLSRVGGDSNVARGARLGSAAGPVGMALGALGGWLMDRHQANQRQEMQQGLNQTLDRDISDTQGRIWGDSGGGTLGQFQPDDMGPPENLAGDDQTSAGPPTLEDRPHNPQERRDAAQAGYGGGGKFAGTPFQGTVTNFVANGQQVIQGSGDPMGRYLRNQRVPGD